MGYIANTGNTFTRSLEDDFIITAKRRIKEILLNDNDIIKLLRERDGITPLYSNVNFNKGYNGIYPFIYVPETQSEDKCYICYQISSFLEDPDNSLIKTYEIKFVTFCSIEKEETGMGANRTDAIGFCLQSLFQGNSPLGLTWYCTENEESIVTAGYIARTLTFYSRAASMTISPSRERDSNGFIKKVRKDANSMMKTSSDTVEMYHEEE